MQDLDRALRKHRTGAPKREIYEEALARLEQLFGRSSDRTARMSTIAAWLKSELSQFLWVGFYVLVDSALTVGPYQGFPACLVLEPHKGVCWAGIDRGVPVVIPDVHAFDGHIVCDVRARSEIVIPLRDAAGAIAGVLDVDSDEYDMFDDIDREYLERIVALVYRPTDTTT